MCFAGLVPYCLKVFSSVVAKAQTFLRGRARKKSGSEGIPSKLVCFDPFVYWIWKMLLLFLIFSLFLIFLSYFSSFSDFLFVFCFFWGGGVGGAPSDFPFILSLANCMPEQLNLSLPHHRQDIRQAVVPLLWSSNEKGSFSPRLLCAESFVVTVNVKTKIHTINGWIQNFEWTLFDLTIRALPRTRPTVSRYRLKE